MRAIIIGLTLALTASGPLAATVQAPAPVSTQPLAPGEVLLEINALAVVPTRADRATLSFPVSVSGDTEAAARASVARELAGVRTVLRAQGVAEGDVRVGAINAYDDSAMSAEMNATAMALDDVANMVEIAPGASASASVEVTIRNADRVPAIQEALRARGIYIVASGITYAVNDDAPGRRAARAQALQKARADAEIYAAALNMRVVRVVRVTERLGLDLLSLAASENQLVGQLFSPAGARQSNGQVPAMVAVGVDFALAPR